MYICVCKAITDKQVQEASKTCANFDEVCKRLGVGSECGACLQDAAVKYNPNLKTSDHKNKSE